MLEKIDAIRGLFAKTPQFAGFDISAFKTEAPKILVPAVNYLLGLEDGKKRFLDLVLAAHKAYSLCSTLDETKAYHKELAFYAAIKATITKFTTVDHKRTQEEKNSVLKQILDNAIIAEGVADVFAMCDLDKPNIGLLSVELVMKQAEKFSNEWSE
jgi:type I restriction enzyme R subunit